MTTQSITTPYVLKYALSVSAGRNVERMRGSLGPDERLSENQVFKRSSHCGKETAQKKWGREKK